MPTDTDKPRRYLFLARALAAQLRRDADKAYKDDDPDGGVSFENSAGAIEWLIRQVNEWHIPDPPKDPPS